MKHNFDELFDRRSSDSIKWNFFDDDVLPLWVADTDFRTPQTVLDALSARIEHGIFGYSRPRETTRLSVQNWLSSRHGWNIQLDDILIIPGVVQAFNVAAAAFSNPGDSVLIQTPAYHPYFDVHTNSNLKQITSPLGMDSNGRYFFDSTNFSNSLRPDTRTFMLCNPHNPTGRVFSEAELSTMAELCIKNNTVICSDEIHSDIVYPGCSHIPIASLSPDIAQSTVTFISTTKTFNLAGLKSSAVIITNPRLRESFRKQLSGLVGSVNILGEIALSTAYDTGSDWLTDLIEYLDENRQFLTDYIKNNLPGVNLYPPEGTYLAWLDCSELDLDDPAEFFLENARVGLNSGKWFGADYKNYARLNFGCPREILASALDRIKQSLASL